MPNFFGDLLGSSASAFVDPLHPARPPMDAGLLAQFFSYLHDLIVSCFLSICAGYCFVRLSAPGALSVLSFSLSLSSVSFFRPTVFSFWIPTSFPSSFPCYTLRPAPFLRSEPRTVCVMVLWWCVAYSIFCSFGCAAFLCTLYSSLRPCLSSFVLYVRQCHFARVVWGVVRAFCEFPTLWITN